MSKLYEWEAFLTKEERSEMNVLGLNIDGYKDTISVYQERRDAIRRKCVQRARNAMNKQVRRLIRAQAPNPDGRDA